MLCGSETFQLISTDVDDKVIKQVFNRGKIL